MLRKGIIGFRHFKDVLLPRVAPATFKSACYGAASLVKAQVVRFEEASVDNNFHSAVLQVGGEQIRVVCNSVFPVLAFATPHTTAKLEFVDSTTLADAFAQISGFEVASKARLDERVSAEMLADLLPVELKQVRKWNPQTVDEVMFNCWD